MIIIIFNVETNKTQPGLIISITANVVLSKPVGLSDDSYFESWKLENRLPLKTVEGEMQSIFWPPPPYDERPGKGDSD